jgi:imidazole glycerol phosphate synthase glutamine amidotransferase subunit|uniref:Imidazole glycerol phosphate synthase subunit HisH n=1 Tax=candidate division WOR-3 bacterium TaxID=2052148 RepID=A0A7V3VU38_UNCW3
MIGIIDYGAGNLHSIKNALNYLGLKNRLIRDEDGFKNIERIILPGVGAFGAAITKLRKAGILERLLEWLRGDKPYLGICLGLQLLFESSEEAEGINGFGIFKGRMKRFLTSKIPQIGWNSIEVIKPSPIFNSQRKKVYFYFLHSYYLDTPEKDIVLARTVYGVSYPSVINKGNIYAVQFHPEKSGKAGLDLLKKWVELC